MNPTSGIWAGHLHIWTEENKFSLLWESMSDMCFGWCRYSEQITQSFILAWSYYIKQVFHLYGCGEFHHLECSFYAMWSRLPLYKHPYLSQWFRVYGRRRLWALTALLQKIKAPTPATKPRKLSQGVLCCRALPFGGLWFPLKQWGLQMGLLGRDHATAHVGISCHHPSGWN